jgi:hypothetical protein
MNINESKYAAGQYFLIGDPWLNLFWSTNYNFQYYCLQYVRPCTAVEICQCLRDICCMYNQHRWPFYPKDEGGRFFCVNLCSLIEFFQRFGGNFCLHLQVKTLIPWIKEIKQAPPKCLCISVLPNGVTFQKAVMFIFIAIGTSTLRCSSNLDRISIIELETLRIMLHFSC